ncbi:LamG-like jellyroll fold domain-containing protein [Nonomuraea typhae]|uniref:LamG-like jellyroll fold domain-containing protein n=1 Tax=Nonomuraea typhae TaxID=2603600 RepID=A0ABW7Z895_9ACTN
MSVVIVVANPETDEPPPPDTSPPTVTRTDPSADSTVSATPEIYVRFNEDVTGARITVTDSSGSPVSGVVEAGHTAAGWTFKPQATFGFGEYRVTVEGAVDPAGNAMTAAYTWTFSVGNTTADGLVAAFGFEEGSGTTVADSSGNNHTGTASATTWVSGKFGNALSFIGSSGSWLSVPDSESLRLTTGMTLSAWVKPTANDGFRTVIMKDHADGSAYGLYASNGTVPSTWFLKPDASSHNQVDGTSALPTTSWSHIATTYDGTTARLHVNGTQVAQLAAAGSLTDDGGALRIGGNIKWGEYFSGIIDEVRAYSRAQSTDEIQADMEKAVSFVPPLRSTAAKQDAAIPPAPDNNLPKAANAFERLTPAKCAQNELSGRPQGWVLNHYSWCQLGRVEALWQSGRCIDPNSAICIPEQETFRAKVMLIGHSFNGMVGVDRTKGDTARDFVVEAYVYEAATYGRMSPTRRMTLTVDIGNKKNCEVVRSRGGQAIDNSRSDIISNWKVNGRATFWFRCAPGKAPVFRNNEWVSPTRVRNDEDVSITTIRPSVNLPDGPNTQWKYITPTVRTVIGNSIRCDSATYIASLSGGCFFTRPSPRSSGPTPQKPSVALWR